MELSNEFEVAAPLEQAWAVLTDLERIAPCLPGAQLQEVEGDEYRGIVKIKVGPITAQYKGSAKFVEKDDEKHRAVLSANGRDTRGQGNASAAITAELEARGDRTHVSVLTDLTITGKVAQFGRGVIGDVSAKLLDQFVRNLETTVLAGEDGVAAERGVAQASSGAEDDAGTTAVVSSNGASDGSSAAREQSAQTTQMLASEIKKIWEEEGAEGGGSESGGAVRVQREALPPRPDLLVAAQDGGESGGDESGSDRAGARKIDSPEAAPIDLLDTAGSSMAKRLVPLVAVVAVVLLVLTVRRRRRRR